MTQKERASRVTRWTAPLLVAMAAVVLALQGIGEPGVRELVRWTARASFLIFSVAFATPFFGPGSWLARNRHGILVSLAVSFGIHALAIGWLGILTHGANLIERSSAFDIVGGAGAYSFLALGAFRPHSRYVGLGLYWLWGALLSVYLPKAVSLPLVFGPAALILGLVMVLRVSASLGRARREPERA